MKLPKTSVVHRLLAATVIGAAAGGAPLAAAQDASGNTGGAASPAGAMAAPRVALEATGHVDTGSSLILRLAPLVTTPRVDPAIASAGRRSGRTAGPLIVPGDFALPLLESGTPAGQFPSAAAGPVTALAAPPATSLFVVPEPAPVPPASADVPATEPPPGPDESAAAAPEAAVPDGLPPEPVPVPPASAEAPAVEPATARDESAAPAPAPAAAVPDSLTLEPAPVPPAPASPAVAGSPTTDSPPAVLSERDPIKVVTIPLGQSRRWTLDQQATAVFAATPEIADVRLLSPNVLYVIGKGVGRTSVAVLDETGLLDEWLVTTVLDLEPVHAVLASDAAFTSVKVRHFSRGVTLTGEVESVAAAERAERLTAATLPENAILENEIRVTAPQQVNLEVQIAEVERSVTETLGINWEKIPDAAAGLGEAVLWRIGRAQFLPGQGGPGADLTTGFADGQPTASVALRYTGSSGTVQGVVDALAGAGLANILAKPNLTAISGETASFFFRRRVPAAGRLPGWRDLVRIQEIRRPSGLRPNGGGQQPDHVDRPPRGFRNLRHLVTGDRGHGDPGHQRPAGRNHRGSRQRGIDRDCGPVPHGFERPRIGCPRPEGPPGLRLPVPAGSDRGAGDGADRHRHR